MLATLLVAFVLSATPAAAQWGNRNAQEKGDLLGRDLAISPFSFFGHTSIFTEYASGDPTDRTSSDETEMLGPPTNAITTQNVQTFIQSSPFRGAFRYLPEELTWQDRRDIVDTITQMKNRPTPIEYVLPPYYNKYLTYTNRDSDPSKLTLNDIDRMRSDAVVEFAYASNGFPLVRPNLYSTIINSPDLFEAIASSNALTYPTANGLIPMDQMFSMLPAFVDLPQMTIYDANNTPIAPSGASSMTAVSVYVSDQLSGPGGLELLQNGSVIAANYFDWAATSHTYTSSDISVLGSLSDGKYTLRAIDQASNWTTVGFAIQTTPTCPSFEDISRQSMSSVIVSTNAPVFVAHSDTAGICSITLEDPYGATIGTATFKAASDAVFGPYPLLSTGTYTAQVTDCAQNVCRSTFDITAGIPYVVDAFTDGTISTATTITVDTDVVKVGTMSITTQLNTNCWTSGGPYFDSGCDYQCKLLNTSCAQTGCQTICASATPGDCHDEETCSFSSVQNATYTVTVATDNPSDPSLLSTVRIWDSSGTVIAITTTTNAPYGGWWVISGTVSVPQVGQTQRVTDTDGNANLDSYFGGVSLSTTALTTAAQTLYHDLLFGLLGNPVSAKGSDFIYTSTTTLSLTAQIPSGLSFDTATVSIQRFDGTSWSSSTVISQTVSVTGSTVTATGLVTQSGEYSLFFVGTDTVPPVTAFSISGSSFVFDQTLFVSTDAYAVLTATDPAVDGFASGVATVTYALDPSSGDAFSVYGSSFPLPLGTHVLEYRAYDYAGNAEAVQSATFTVTAGAALKDTGDDQVGGNLLAGFLGSGAQAEVVATAQNDMTLAVSSADRTVMLGVTNVGSVGVGVSQPAGQLDLGPADLALQLRSGNTVSTGTAAQMAFGYDGGASMRHLLRTYHSTATAGNSMDFLVWDPDAGSTTTVAARTIMSLQAIAAASNGSLHVDPVGTADAEVEVSNGLTTGGGTMERLQWVMPSSSRFKYDIRYLKDKDEDRALAETAALRHVRFRYKSRAPDGRLYDDPRQAERVGLIYEDAPKSLQTAGDTLSETERLANVELALQAAMRRVDELEKRYQALKHRRVP
jgi:hypothetical protein